MSASSHPFTTGEIVEFEGTLVQYDPENDVPVALVELEGAPCESSILAKTETTTLTRQLCELTGEGSTSSTTTLPTPKPEEFPLPPSSEDDDESKSEVPVWLYDCDCESDTSSLIVNTSDAEIVSDAQPENCPPPRACTADVIVAPGLRSVLDPCPESNNAQLARPTKKSNRLSKYVASFSKLGKTKSNTVLRKPSGTTALKPGKALVDSTPTVLPVKFKDYNLRTSKQGGRPILEAASKMVIQLCTIHPLSVPTFEIKTRVDGSNPCGNRFWINAIVSTGSSTSMIVRSKIPQDGLIINDGLQALVPLFVVGTNVNTEQPTVMQLQICADVLSDEQAESLGGFDMILGYSALLQYSAAVGCGSGEVVFTEAPEVKGEKGRAVSVKTVNTVLPEEVEAKRWSDEKGLELPWVIG